MQLFGTKLVGISRYALLEQEGVGIGLPVEVEQVFHSCQNQGGSAPAKYFREIPVYFPEPPEQPPLLFITRVVAVEHGRPAPRPSRRRSRMELKLLFKTVETEGISEARKQGFHVHLVHGVPGTLQQPDHIPAQGKHVEPPFSGEIGKQGCEVKAAGKSDRFLECEGKPVLFEVVGRQKNRQAVSLVLPEQGIVHKAPGRLEQFLDLRGPCPGGGKPVLRLLEQVFKADRVLLRLPSGPKCGHEKGHAEFPRMSGKFLELLPGNFVHEKSHLLNAFYRTGQKRGMFPLHGFRTPFLQQNRTPER